jgi:acyltransferase
VFYGAGYLCRPLIDQITQRRGRLILALLPVGAIYVGCSLINTKVAVVAGVYGNYALFYLAAFSGIAFWMLIAMLVPGNRLMQRIGASTLVIFPMHLLVFPFITAVLIYVLKWPPDIRYHSIALSLCYALISIGVLIPISDLMMRHAPVLLGLPPSKPKD